MIFICSSSEPCTQNHEFMPNNFVFPNKGLYGPFMDRFPLSQATESLQGDSLLLTTKSPGGPGTHLIDLKIMKGLVDLGATQWF